jgi:hypothetical protein
MLMFKRTEQTTYGLIHEDGGAVAAVLKETQVSSHPFERDPESKKW